MTATQLAAMQARWGETLSGLTAGGWVSRDGELVEDAAGTVMLACRERRLAAALARVPEDLRALLDEVERCWTRLARQEEAARLLVAIVGEMVGLAEEARGC